ncbi:MAG: aldo/keto reductase [Saccharofermentans sp.]|nr:aldo/keto reductase [Saccharofermentans sp.]
MNTFMKTIDKLNVNVSCLGFGCMRFPTKDGKIDEERATKMLDDAYKAGINYFDTAYPYHGGESEPFVGKVLDKYPRESYFLATKLPCWEIKTLDDAKAMFQKQLDRLHKDYVDFFLLHSLFKDRWELMRDLGVVEYLEEEKAKGRIKFLGFSFHDDYEVFEDIVNYKDWDFCQIQLNYMDTLYQAGMKGYDLATKHNIPLMIMEPIKGGLLANLPEEVDGIFKAVKPDYSTASWALRWVASLPNVKVVLSGMSTEDQLADNLKTFSDFELMTDEELAAVDKVASELQKRVFNGCTGCKYCMPCPAGVNIPGNFSLWNRFGIYQDKGDANWHWNNDINESEKAINCVSCGMCEPQCPQKISIREDLLRVTKTFREIE